jgi:CRP/FNR family transcriptional regulator/CRP/FNR family cyclic AMP-dependent transcriptional regulator
MDRLDMRRVPLFADLTDAQLETLIQDFNRRQFRRDEAIFQQGDPGQALYMVESGQVRIYVQDEEGQEVSVILCGPGDLFGELALIDGLPRSASAVAMEDTVVLALSHDHFREQMRRYPQMALNLMKALSVRVRYNTQQVGSLTLLDIPGRLAHKLLELAQDHG